MGTRRGNGEGSVSYDEKNKRWRGMYWVVQNGLKKRQSVYSRESKADCLALMRKEQASAAEGKPMNRNGLKLGDYLYDWWKKGVKREQFRPTTAENYERIIRKHINPYIGHKLLSSLTRLDIQNLVDALLDNHPSGHASRDAKSAPSLSRITWFLSCDP